MNTTKTVVAIAREASSLEAITTLQEAVSAAMQADGKEASTIQACAKTLAAQVAHLDLPLSSKVALIRATYADEFGALASTKDLTKEQGKRKSNAVAGLIAAVTCYCASDMPVEVAAPTDGKDAVFKKAGELSLSAMKANAATVKETAKAAETVVAQAAMLAAMTPEEKLAAQAASAQKASAAKAASDAAKATLIAEANAETCKEFIANLSGILASNDNREALDAAFLHVGLKLQKCKASPSGESLAAQLAALK